MSYILEALKKAQAERQLGSAPTIHALPIQAAPPERAGAGKAPLAIALTAAVVAATGAGVMWWRQATPVAPPLAASAVVAPAPIAQAPPAPVPLQMQPQAPVQIEPQAPVQIQPQPQRQATLAPSALAVAPKPAPVKNRAPAPTPAPTTAAAPPAVAAAPPGPSPAAPEENLPMLRDLPESQRSGVPQVTFGGYMYSPNPADRLLLIDKTLRHEGEEVAPGLVLEKLLPKAAVMNYRGTRYRVAF